MKKLLLLLLILLTLTAVQASAEDAAQPVSYTGTYKQVLSYAQEHQPAALDIGTVTFSVDELYTIKQALPEGASLIFCSTWKKLEFSSDTVDLDLNKTRERITSKTLRKLIALCPGVKKISLETHKKLENSVVIPVLEEHPEIEFVWLVHLGYTFAVPSNAETFTCYSYTASSRKLTSQQLAVLKYAPNLKVLDLVHHQITTLDFLYDLPELRVLILAVNQITDITPVASLKKLQYLELFCNYKLSDLSPLAGMNTLLDLNVSQTIVSDLSPLENLTSLERLWANSTKISQEDWEQYVCTHPNLTESSHIRSHSTSGTWRKHPRYSQYTAALRNHKWTEFSESK